MKKPKYITFIIQAGFALATLILFLFWLDFTPHGWMGKLDAIGYSVCHQIPSHSFLIGSTPFPLCSRCMGMYLGIFIGVAVLIAKGKASGIPSLKIIAIFGLLISAWLIDGFNSFFYGFFGKALLYNPNNTLRLITGFGMGLCIAVTITILFNMTVWQNRDKTSPINFNVIRTMMVGAILTIFLIHTNNEILMKIFAYISSMTVMALLTALYTIVWIILLHKENSYKRFRKLGLMVNVGVFCALLQVFLLDALRLALTGTWTSLVK
jgi:uncharacterized membrane protein